MGAKQFHVHGQSCYTKRLINILWYINNTCRLTIIHTLTAIMSKEGLITMYSTYNIYLYIYVCVCPRTNTVVNRWFSRERKNVIFWISRCLWLFYPVFLYKENVRTIKTQIHHLKFTWEPCFSIFIKKSQDQTLRTIGVDLSAPCFTHDQLYVAASWACNT